MPQVLLTTTGTVSGQDVIYDMSNKGSNRGNGVIAYLDVELGGGSMTYSVKTYDSAISENYYYYSLEDAGTMSIQTYYLDADGKYRLPLPVTTNEEKVAIEFGPLATATITANFNIDSQYR